MESVIDNSGCLANQRVKYAASSFIGKALTCNEIEKLESEFWNHSMIGADFSFISTKFMPLLNEKPSIANSEYVIEVANGKKEEVDRIFCGLGMDWLSNQKAVIVCHEKIVRIPVEEGKVLCVQGERNVGKTKTLMSTKANEPTLSDIPIVRDFEDIFLNDLSGLPPQRQVEFRIDLIPEATPVAKSPYRLAPSELQELS
ncbi:hypothetical protein Tco_1271851 [Tanacetum coccineum]